MLKLNAPSHVEADREADALAAVGRATAQCGSSRATMTQARIAARALHTRDAALARGRRRDGTRRRRLLPRLQVDAGDEPIAFPLLATRPTAGTRSCQGRYADAGRPFERALLDAALDVYRTVDRSAPGLVNQDLHGGNVLAAEREPWLVIDPKPLVGERELEASGLLRNADDVSRWLDALADLGFDRERARAWGVAHNLAWAWDERRGWLEEHVEDARRILSAR